MCGGWTTTWRLATWVLLAGGVGCAILPGAGMPFPDDVQDQPVADEAPAEPGDQQVFPAPQTPPRPAPASRTTEPQPPALPPLEPLVVTQLDEATPVPALDEQILSVLLSEPLPVIELLRLLLRETDLSLVPDPGIDETFTGELRALSLRQALDARAASARPRLPSGGWRASGRSATASDTGIRSELRHHSPRRHQTGVGRVLRGGGQRDRDRLDRRPRLLHRARTGRASAVVGRRPGAR